MIWRLGIYTVMVGLVCKSKFTMAEPVAKQRQDEPDGWWNKNEAMTKQTT